MRGQLARPVREGGIEIEDEAGKRLAKARLPEGLAGIAELHALVAKHAPANWADLPAEQVAAQVVVGIETDRGPRGAGVVGGRLPGICDQSDVLGPISRTALHIGRQERRRGRTCPG